MFGYIRPYQDELKVREHRQYKAVYCQLCRTMKKEYGWLSTFSLNYDCTFYAMLALSVSGCEMCEQTARCAANPLKKCRYISSQGEEYKKAAALSVLLTYHKLADDRDDEGFLKATGCKMLLPLVKRKAKKAAELYPQLAQAAQTAMQAQRTVEADRLGIDACAEPTAQLLADVFSQLAEGAQARVLSQFGYYLGRWVYLMDAADDIADDAHDGKFNPFVIRLGIEKGEIPEEKLTEARNYCNSVLNATVAAIIPPLQLLQLGSFAEIIDNIIRCGLPEMQREKLFLNTDKKGKGKNSK